MTKRKGKLGAAVKAVRVDEHGGRLELMGNIGDATMFVTVARPDDDEDDERVFEIELDDFIEVVSELWGKLD